MAIIVAVERRWIGREEAVDRLLKMVRFLYKADSYHGILPHFLNGETGQDDSVHAERMTAAISSKPPS